VTDLTGRRATAADASAKLAVDRTRLAYERTMLSWVETATALITFGFSIQQFFRVASSENAEKPGVIGPHEFGMAMIVVGLVALLLATVGHRSAIRALNIGYPVTEQDSAIPRSPAGVLAALEHVPADLNRRDSHGLVGGRIWRR
jgi:putative membrane protein